MSRRPEPALVTGAITAAVAAIIAVLALFGVDLSEGTRAGVTGVVTFLAPLVAGWLTRSSVTPVADPHATDGTPLVKADEPPAA